MLEVLRDLDGLYKLSFDPVKRRMVSYNPNHPLLWPKLFSSKEKLEETLNGVEFNIKSIYEEKEERSVKSLSDQELERKRPGLFKKLNEKSTKIENENDFQKNYLYELASLRLIKAVKNAKGEETDFIAGMFDILVFLFPEKEVELQNILC